MAASKQSYLMFSEGRAEAGKEHSREEGEILYSSPHGIPLLWLFAFGERNVWEPGDNVRSRGGAVGERNLHEIAVEVALLRLNWGREALADNEHIWPWLSAMGMFYRKLSLKSKTGFIRIAAPWLLKLKGEERDRWRSSTAFVENYVNFLSANRRTEAAESIRRISLFCPFVPQGYGIDRKTFEKMRLYKKEDKAIRLALLTLGEPVDRNIFEKGVLREVAPALERHEQLRPLDTPASKLVKLPAMNTGHGGSVTAQPLGFLGRLTGFLKKR